MLVSNHQSRLVHHHGTDTAGQTFVEASPTEAETRYRRITKIIPVNFAHFWQDNAASRNINVKLFLEKVGSGSIQLRLHFTRPHDWNGCWTSNVASI
jgi:hypothetical protein